MNPNNGPTMNDRPNLKNEPNPNIGPNVINNSPKTKTDVSNLNNKATAGGLVASETPVERAVKDTARVLPGACWRDSEGSVVADRVCIDFVRNLSPSEGCWIGSSAKVMALVLSEAVESGFIPSRPFRVNAGPVHSYVCLADGSTKYLGELQAGDEVLVLDADTGRSRSVAVGRLKIEVRPCVLVKLAGMNLNMENNENQMNQSSDLDGNATPERPLGQLFLQQVETVRLGQPGGRCIPVTGLEIATAKEIQKQQSVLLRISDQGTHMGRPSPGSVREL